MRENSFQYIPQGGESHIGRKICSPDERQSQLWFVSNRTQGKVLAPDLKVYVVPGTGRTTGG